MSDAPSDDTQLDPHWATWIAENLLRGAPPRDLWAVLESEGVPPDRARAEVNALDGSAALEAARRVMGRSAGVEQAARLVRAHAQAGWEVDSLDDTTFELGYRSAHRPVVFRQGARNWPALEWTHRGLAERVGEVEVEVLRGRSDHAQWWLKRETLRTRIRFAELLEQCLETTGDDLYAVGRNDLLDEPGLAVLKDEIGRLPGCKTDPGARLWIGPAGTRTPLHHDQNSAWLVQVEGQKQIWIASPLEPTLLDSAQGVFNRFKPDSAPPNDPVHWRTTTLEPGDAVFLPVGWWHQVVAIRPSISVSLGHLNGDVPATWYHPGRRMPG
ncbi:MAG: cupin-like domain-containing protein [Myxococcota bacterium]